MDKLFFKIQFVNLIGLILLASCYDDKGNYNYTNIDKVSVDTVGLGIQSSYVVSRYDTLKMTPNITFNDVKVTDNSDVPLEYVWTIYVASTGSNLDYTVDTIGVSRNLKAPITRTAGAYYVQLTVRNKKNDIRSYFKVNCQVEESLTAGWMILYEPTNKPGTSDVGLVVNPWVKKNITKNKEFWNLYSASNGAPVNGAPLRVLHTVVTITNDEVVISTDQNMVGVNQGTFTRTLGFKDFFYNAPSASKVSYYGVGGTSTRAEMVINDNKVYSTMYSALTRNNFFGVAKTGTYGELAPWGSDVHTPNFDVVVYDQTNGKFIYTPRNKLSFASFAAQNLTSAAFDVNNTDGMKLLMGDWGFSFYDYLLMQKDTKYYLAVANFNTSTAATTNVGRGLYDISNSPEIANVASMTAAYTGQYVLYGAGSSVYNLMYNSSTVANKLWGAASTDEKVTCVRLQKFYFNSFYFAIMPNPNTILHIATYNEKTGEGKLYQYQINAASGALLGDPKVYTVPGRVKDMAWKYVIEY